MLTVYVDGKEVDRNLVMNSSMGFGEGSVDGRSPNSYKLALDVKDIVMQISDLYDRFIEMDKLDDEDVDEDFPELQLLRDLKHPSLAHMAINEPNLLADLIKKHLAVEVLSCLFPTSEEEIYKRKYNLNSIDQIDIEDEKLNIFGDVFPIDR